MSKDILLVSATDYTDQVYAALNDVLALGYRLHLLSDGMFEPRTGIFDNHFKYDIRQTKETVEYMRKQDIEFDAVTLQFSDLLTPLVAMLAKEYGCIGNSPSTAFHCRSKYHMRKRLQEADVPSPQFRLCKNYDELRQAVLDIGLPCIAKPVGLSSSYGVFALRKESDLINLRENYESSICFLKKKLAAEDIFDFTPDECEMMGIEEFANMTTDYLVEEFLDGPEISVDTLTQDGETTIMGVADQTRMELPYFVQLAETMPYACSPERQAEIESLVKATVKAMGIQNSAAHTEIIFTKEGPKIVEIGCRMGGDNIHDSIYQTTGYNPMFESIMIALGEKREYTVKTLCHSAMEYLLPTKAGVVQKVEISPSIKKDPDVTEIYIFPEEGERVSPPPAGFDYMGYVSVKGETPELAQKKLKEAIDQINIIIAHD